MAKILIIDDDADIVESMKIVLESKQHKIATAFSGSEGLTKAKKGKPDLIILDIMMETGDRGFEVARELKEDKDLKSVPILMLTALKERTGLDFQKEAGDETWLPVDDYLDKPLSPDDLIAKVNNLLQNK